MQGTRINLVLVGRKGITSVGQTVSGKVMDCPRKYGYNATVVRTLDGKFRKWNPICAVSEVK
jgi:hypothetical protein